MSTVIVAAEAEEGIIRKRLPTKRKIKENKKVCFLKKVTRGVDINEDNAELILILFLYNTL